MVCKMVWFVFFIKWVQFLLSFGSVPFGSSSYAHIWFSFYKIKSNHFLKMVQFEPKPISKSELVHFFFSKWSCFLNSIWFKFKMVRFILFFTPLITSTQSQYCCTISNKYSVFELAFNSTKITLKIKTINRYVLQLLKLSL